MILQSLAMTLILAAPIAHITGPTEVQPGWPFYLSSKDSISDRPLQWSIKKGSVPFTVMRDEATKVPVIFIPAAGAAGEVYQFKLVASGDNTADAEIHEVRVVSATKTVSDDVRVIIVVETSANISRAHYNVLTSPAIKEYLDKRTKGWRRWDPDIRLVNETPEWQDMWERTKKSIITLPAIAIFVGNTGTVYPLPNTETELLQLLMTKVKKAG